MFYVWGGNGSYLRNLKVLDVKLKQTLICQIREFYCRCLNVWEYLLHRVMSLYASSNSITANYL